WSLVNRAADWTGPVRVLRGGPGAFVVGGLDGRPTSRVHSLAKLLNVVASTVVSDNILGYTWAKHVYGALLVATAVVNAHVYEVVERSPETQRMLIALVMESMRVAESAGIRLEPFDEYDPADYRAAACGEEAARARDYRYCPVVTTFCTGFACSSLRASVVSTLTYTMRSPLRPAIFAQSSGLLVFGRSSFSLNSSRTAATRSSVVMPLAPPPM